MAQANDTKGILYENLIDAFCDEKLTRECMELAEGGMNKQILQKLSAQRSKLSDIIHKYQKALDCLDYLIFQIQNRKNI